MPIVHPIIQNGQAVGALSPQELARLQAEQMQAMQEFQTAGMTVGAPPPQANPFPVKMILAIAAVGAVIGSALMGLGDLFDIGGEHAAEHAGALDQYGDLLEGKSPITQRWEDLQEWTQHKSGGLEEWANEHGIYSQADRRDAQEQFQNSGEIIRGNTDIDYYVPQDFLEAMNAHGTFANIDVFKLADGQFLSVDTMVHDDFVHVIPKDMLTGENAFEGNPLLSMNDSFNTESFIDTENPATALHESLREKVAELNEFAASDNTHVVTDDGTSLFKLVNGDVVAIDSTKVSEGLINVVDNPSDLAPGLDKFISGETDMYTYRDGTVIERDAAGRMIHYNPDMLKGINSAAMPDTMLDGFDRSTLETLQSSNIDFGNVQRGALIGGAGAATLAAVSTGAPAIAAANPPMAGIPFNHVGAARYDQQVVQPNIERVNA